ncbi:MAG: FtsX-like permease family protein [Gammaproteobacteria bacterium]|nr:FtsX-like permease family protein [Gammaproteobacteria bacterium]
MWSIGLKLGTWFSQIDMGFARSLRLSEFRLLLLACLFVVIALSVVGALGSRIEQAMQLRTSAIMGADAILSSSRPLSQIYWEVAEDLGLKTADSISFMSMLTNDQESRLVNVRAVSENYPLRGEILIKSDTSPEGFVEYKSSPDQGTVWAATQAVVDLGLNELEKLQIGDMQADFIGEIMLDPEGGADRIRFAPRVIINISDLESTGLLTPASRARYRLLVAGDREAIEVFYESVSPELESYEEIVVADIQRDEVNSTVGRIISYIRLAVLLSVILSIVAMALAAQGLWRRQIVEMALLRCLGQQNKKTMLRLGFRYLTMGIPVCMLGALIGFAIQDVVGRIVQQQVIMRLPEPSFWSLAGAGIITLIALFVVTLPTLRAVQQVPSVILLRTSSSPPMTQQQSSFSILILIVALTIFLAGDIMLALTVLPGLLLAALLFWGVTRLLIYVVGRIVGIRSLPYFVALKEVCSNGARSAWIVSTFGSIVFALVLLAVFRYDIFESWGQTLPDDSPNVFAINIKQSNLEPLGEFINGQNVTRSDIYSIIRTRIVEINGRPISEYNFTGEAKDRVSHVFNLTETADLPQDNEVVQGQWFQGNASGLSVEDETASELGLELGDTLTLDTAGIRHTAPILNLREVVWENMRPNFFIIATPGLLEDAPVSHMLAVHVDDDINRFINQMSREFPNISAINVSILLQRFQEIVNQGSMAISTLFVFTLLAAGLVFFGILQGQKITRQLQIALLKSMGASRSFIRKAVISEFALLGIFSGLLGSAMALLTGTLMADQIFDMELTVSWSWMAISIAVGIVLVSIAGYLSIRGLLGVVPVRLLANNRG